MVQKVLLECEKEVGSINYSRVEKISSVNGKEERKNMSVVERENGSGL